MNKTQSVDVRPETRRDITVVADFKQLCERWSRFYFELSGCMEDQNCRNHMLSMANTRLMVACDLEVRLQTMRGGYDPDYRCEAYQVPVEAMACPDLDKEESRFYFQKILEEDGQLLEFMRKKVKATRTPSIASLLAFHLASLQLAHDGAATLFDVQ